MRYPLIALMLVFLTPTSAFSASELAGKCRELGRSKQFQAAIQLVDKYESSFPNDENAIYCRGEAKYSLGDKKGALLDLKEAYSYDPTYLEVLKGIIQIYQELGDEAGMCENWSLLKMRNAHASRDDRYDLDTPYGYRLDRACSR